MYLYVLQLNDKYNAYKNDKAMLLDIISPARKIVKS